ncbi:MAG: acetate--CoA ligase family protein [Alphaproteobacteria bacterium]|nr:acetate--CoA ligase family protein [Alphaproteobacteria bacterium]
MNRTDRLYALSILAPPARVLEYEEDGLLVFEDPTRAVTALHAMGRFGAAFARPPAADTPAVPPVPLPTGSPDEAEAKRLLAQAGIACVPERACATAEEAVAAAEALGWPVVLKLLSPHITHKSDIGGVLLDVADATAVRIGFATLLERARAVAPHARVSGVLVARQLRGGTECILGIKRDPVFGPVAMFGLGGVFVEVLRDVVLHRCPFGEDVAERMIRTIRGAPLLLGARGRRLADVRALAAMLARLSVFADQAGPRLAAIDLNPVIAMPDGEGTFAVDAVIELEPAHA